MPMLRFVMKPPSLVESCVQSVLPDRIISFSTRKLQMLL